LAEIFQTFVVNFSGADDADYTDFSVFQGMPIAKPILLKEKSASSASSAPEKFIVRF